MPLPRKHSSSVRSAYTLVEVLIVMGIIVLAITLAIPAIRSLTGSKSTQAAQNTVSAFLARTRTEAIGLQQIEGVLFYIDPATDRVTLAQVQVVPFETGDVPGVTYLDLVPDHDSLVIPPGIRLWTLKESVVPPTPLVDPFPRYRYLGFNSTANGGPTYSGNTTSIGGVILFDGYGRLYTGRYGFRFTDHPPGGTPILTALGILAFGSATVTPPPNWPSTTTSTQYLRSQIGFSLFDRATFLSQVGGGKNFTDSNLVAGPNQEPSIDPWLDQNTSPILVNRYNGTLTRAE